MDSYQCKRCSANYDLNLKKPVIFDECSHQVCEYCFLNSLDDEDDGAKTCPFCFSSCYQKNYNQDLLNSIERRDIENQRQIEVQRERQILRQREEEQKNSICSNSSSATARTMDVLPKINAIDIPWESDLKYRYRTEAFIGSGSFGDVRMSSSRQRYAIKTFKEQPTDQELLEISIMKGIKSQYICELYDLFRTTDNKFSIVYEYAQYGDLLNYCKNTLDWDIPEDLAKEWLTCVVLGLKELHSKGNGRISIQKAIRDYELHFSRDALDQNYDFSTDIYSLGITFIQLLTKEFPTQIEIQDPLWLPNIEGMSGEFIALLRRMVAYNKNERPTIVDLMFHPVITQTKVMKNYRKTHGIMTLGFANFNPESMKLLSDQGVGCPNCSLILCNDCFRKKVESSFLMLNDMLGHANEISKKTEELLSDAKEELFICQAIYPQFDTMPYKKILGLSEQMVDDSLMHQKMRSQVQNLILDLEPQIKQSQHSVIENAEKFNAELASELKFSAIIQKFKSLQNIEKEKKLLRFQGQFFEEEKSQQIENQDWRSRNDFSIPMPLKKFSFDDFRQLIDNETQTDSFIRFNIPNFDSSKHSIALVCKEKLYDFNRQDKFLGILVFIQSQWDHVFGFYTSCLNVMDVSQGTMLTDKDAFIFSLSYQTIHKIAIDAEYSLLATQRGLNVGGSLNTMRPDIFLDSHCTDERSINSNNLGQSYKLPSGSFVKGSIEAQKYLSGETTFRVVQIETYCIQVKKI
eukprot:403372995